MKMVHVRPVADLEKNLGWHAALNILTNLQNIFELRKKW